MIVVTQDNDVYSVRFEYPRDAVHEMLDGGRTVTCRISRQTNSGAVKSDDVYEPLTTGTARCSKEDNYNHRVGRLIAFRRAVEVLHGANAEDTRKLRRAFWETFRAKCKLPTKMELNLKPNLRYSTVWIKGVA